MSRSCLDPAILRMLEEAGVDWHLRPKRCHVQLVVLGVVVETLSRCDRERAGRQAENARAAVRRHLRSLTQEPQS